MASKTPPRTMIRIRGICCMMSVFRGRITNLRVSTGGILKRRDIAGWFAKQVFSRRRYFTVTDVSCGSAWRMLRE